MTTVVTAASGAAVAAVPRLAAPRGAAHHRAAHHRPAQQTVAWRDGRLQVDTRRLIGRSDLVLEHPPWRPEQSMPLGNGRLGVAVWGDHGLTAQLNRNDTFPNLKSAGRLVVPGLAGMDESRNYRGRLDLYDGELRQSGGGMSARTYVRAGTDQLVVQVSGAPRNKTQTADLELWPGRTPTTYASNGVAALAETFTDSDSNTTGQVAAMTADARDVSATVVDPETVRLRFRPRAHGTFRIVVGVPFYTGGAVGSASENAVTGVDDPHIEQAHLAWWHRFWASAEPMRITSRNGAGEYMEALRAQELYTTAASERNTLPSGQAGAVDMFYPWQDSNTSPSTWFHFNLRQDVYANYGSGLARFNAPYLRLYTSHLAQLEAYTQQHWAGAQGACVPELLQYTGVPSSCMTDADPAWTNRIITGGLEVSHDIWMTAHYTGDRSYLTRGWPLMRDVALFYLSQLQAGSDGFLHLQHINSFETQWDTTDPTTDEAGMRVMFPIFASLAARHGDAALAARLRDAVTKLPPIATTTRNGTKVIAWSATDEPAHNTQNTDMEPLYPWGVLDAHSALMQHTFDERVFPETREWNEDPIWAARLDRAAAMRRLLVSGTERLQKLPNGYTVHTLTDDPATAHAMYSEWGGVVAGALQDALVQTYTGTIRIAAAWPKDWSVSGSVQIPGNTTLTTEVKHGVPAYVGINAGSRRNLSVANPWPGKRAEVIAATGKQRVVVAPTADGTLTIPVRKGGSYLLQRVADPVSGMRFAPVAGSPATHALHLGDRTLGVARSEPEISSRLVSDISPRYLPTLRARTGDPLYVDTSDAIAALPAALRGTVMIQGAQSDRKLTAPDDYLSFDLSRPAKVYVAFDSRGRGSWWPQWLQQQGFAETGSTVGVDQYSVPLRTVDGTLLATSGAGRVVTTDGADWPADQIIDTTVQQVQVGTGIMFHASDPNNGYFWTVGGPLGDANGLTQLRMAKIVDGQTTVLGTVALTPEPRNTYHLRIVTSGSDIKTYVDGALVDDRQDSTFASGRVGIGQASAGIGRYRYLTVKTPDGQTLLHDSFDNGLGSFDVPSTLQNVPLTVFEKDLPAGPVSLGPNSGVSGEGDASYVTFVGDRPTG